MMDSNSVEDLFESSLRLEDTHMKQGFREGYEAGLLSGREDARHLGLKLGFETGELLGFYKGCACLWNSAVRVDPTRFSAQTQKHLKEFDDLIEKYPLLDPEDESIDKIKHDLRVKFNIICASLACDNSRGEEMLRQTLGCCKVYISEGRNRAALEAVERAAKLFPPAAIVNKFEDVAYGRVGYTVVSRLTTGKLPDSSSSLKNAVFAMVKTALDTIDLELHSGFHPRLGVVDHMCFHPLAQTSLEEVAGIAKTLAMDIGSVLQVPTFLYGAAHEEQRTLDWIRRKLGYYKPNAEGNRWVGGLEFDKLPLKPDAGTAQVTKSKGVIIVGASGWVGNYNVPVLSSDISAARRIGKRVSERGGGLASVQAMALAHEKGVTEVACNLLDPSKVGGDKVQKEIERLAREEGMAVGKGYYTDYPPEQVAEKFMKLIAR